MREAFKTMGDLPAGVCFLPGVAGCGKTYMGEMAILFSQVCGIGNRSTSTYHALLPRVEYSHLGISPPACPRNERGQRFECPIFRGH